MYRLISIFLFFITTLCPYGQKKKEVLTVLMFLLREWRISLAILFVSLTSICGCLLTLWGNGHTTKMQVVYCPSCTDEIYLQKNGQRDFLTRKSGIGLSLFQLFVYLFNKIQYFILAQFLFRRRYEDWRKLFPCLQHFFLISFDVLLQALASAEPASIGEIGEHFVLPLAAEGSVYIVGCGHVGQALVPVLASLGLNVIVVDDRPALLEAASIPAGVNTLCIPYAEFSQTVSLTLRDYVIVCTSSHATDLAVVRQALAAHPSFVGCLGSKKKAAFIRGKLAEDGLSADDMAQLHMPVGIPLGDETPAEIAISIAAQLII